METSGVDLGFVEECPSYLLTNRYFPSKVGGKPAWLDLQNIPKPEHLQCSQCQEPMNFLCQVYAPIESDPEAFHRSIFLFICTTEACNKPNSAQHIKSFRSQLKQENDFYSPVAPDEDDELPAIDPPCKLCPICGCCGPLACSKCKIAFYCSKSHQRIDWKGGHKQICDGVPKAGGHQSTSSTSTLFPEFDIEIEPEPDCSQPQTDDNEETDQRRLAEYENLLEEGKAGNLSSISEAELLQYSNPADDDKVFRRFKKRTDLKPEQILRYQRGGQPLPIANTLVDEMHAIPDCDNCGNKRTFEFQIMPQLLNYLKNNALDWGSILVYTCSANCSTGSQYIQEFVLKQDIQNSSKKE